MKYTKKININCLLLGAVFLLSHCANMVNNLEKEDRIGTHKSLGDDFKYTTKECPSGGVLVKLREDRLGNVSLSSKGVISQEAIEGDLNIYTLMDFRHHGFEKDKAYAKAKIKPCEQTYQVNFLTTEPAEIDGLTYPYAKMGENGIWLADYEKKEAKVPFFINGDLAASNPRKKGPLVNEIEFVASGGGVVTLDTPPSPIGKVVKGIPTLSAAPGTDLSFDLEPSPSNAFVYVYFGNNKAKGESASYEFIQNTTPKDGKVTITLKDDVKEGKYSFHAGYVNTGMLEVHKGVCVHVAAMVTAELNIKKEEKKK